MPRMTTFIDQELPSIKQMTIEFDNGKLIEIQATQVERLDLLQWIGPEDAQLMGDVRFTCPAIDLGPELEPFDGR